MQDPGSVIRKELRALGRPRPSILGGDASTVRSFYEELLGGRQVWPSGRGAGSRRFWFLFGEQLIEAGPVRSASHEMLEVEVESPSDTAARCWDAGYTVQLLKNRAPGALSVFDPFGRQIALVERRAPADAQEA